MPQKDRKFADYVAIASNTELNIRRSFDELQKHTNANPHRVFKKKPSPGRLATEKKYAQYWHVKPTYLSKQGKKPTDILAFEIMQLLFPELIQATGFKMRLWFDEESNQYLVASKHLNGFQTWHDISKNITINPTNGNFTLNNVPVVGYGLIHLFSYLFANYDLHTRNFGVVPIYNEAGQLVQYNVLIIDFDLCFNPAFLAQAALTTDFSLDDELVISRFDLSQINFYRNKSLDQTAQAYEERYDGYFKLLQHRFSDLLIPLPEYLDDKQFSKVVRLLETRRLSILSAAIQVPSIFSELNALVTRAFINNDLATLSKIIRNNPPTITKTVLVLSDQQWLTLILNMIDTGGSEDILALKTLLKDENNLFSDLFAVFEVQSTLFKLPTPHLDRLLTTFSDDETRVLGYIAERLDVIGCLRLLIIHVNLQCTVLRDLCLEKLGVTPFMAQVGEAISSVGVHAWLQSLCSIKQSHQFASQFDHYLNATLLVLTSNQPNLEHETLATLLEAFAIITTEVPDERSSLFHDVLAVRFMYVAVSMLNTNMISIEEWQGYFHLLCFSFEFNLEDIYHEHVHQFDQSGHIFNEIMHSKTDDEQLKFLAKNYHLLSDLIKFNLIQSLIRQFHLLSAEQIEYFFTTIVDPDHLVARQVCDELSNAQTFALLIKLPSSSTINLKSLCEDKLLSSDMNSFVSGSLQTNGTLSWIQILVNMQNSGNTGPVLTALLKATSTVLINSVFVTDKEDFSDLLLALGSIPGNELHIQDLDVHELIAARIVVIANQQRLNHVFSIDNICHLFKFLQETCNVNLACLYGRYLHTLDSEHWILTHIVQQMNVEQRIELICQFNSVVPTETAQTILEDIIQSHSAILSGETGKLLRSLKSDSMKEFLMKAYHDLITDAARYGQLDSIASLLTDLTIPDLTKIARISDEVNLIIIQFYYSKQQTDRVLELIKPLTLQNQAEVLNCLLTDVDYATFSVHTNFTYIFINRLITQWQDERLLTLENLKILEAHCQINTFICIVRNLCDTHLDNIASDISLYLFKHYTTVSSDKFARYLCARFDRTQSIIAYIPLISTEAICKKVAQHIKNTVKHYDRSTCAYATITALINRAVELNNSSYDLYSYFGSGTNQQRRKASKAEQFCIELSLDLDIFLNGNVSFKSNLYGK